MNRRGFLGMLAGLAVYFFPRKTVAKPEPFTDMWDVNWTKVEVDDPMSVTDGDFLTMLAGLKQKYPKCTGEYLIGLLLNPNEQQCAADLVRDWRQQIDTHKRAYIRAMYNQAGIPCRLNVLQRRPLQGKTAYRDSVMVNYQQLLYVLERVKVFYAHGEEEEACCRQLESDRMEPLAFTNLKTPKIHAWSYHEGKTCTTNLNELPLDIYTTFCADEITEYYYVRRYPLWKKDGYEQSICIPVK